MHAYNDKALNSKWVLLSSRRRGPAELLDNNVLLFGQWYRKLVASNKV